MLKHIFSLLIFTSLIVINQLLSIRFQLDKNYLQFYLDNGSLIGLITAIVVISWGDLNKHIGLISPKPHTYYRSCLKVVLLPIHVLADESKNVSEKWDLIVKGYKHGIVGFKREDFWMFWDLIFGPLLLLLVIIALTLWLILVAPLQYFIFLLAGAPARILGMFSSEISIATLKEDKLRIKSIAKKSKIPEGWWDASFSQKPVAVTAVISSVILWIANLAV